MLRLLREAAKTVIFLVARPIRPLSFWQHFFRFFFELKKSSFFLVAKPLPIPPPLQLSLLLHKKDKEML